MRLNSNTPYGDRAALRLGRQLQNAGQNEGQLSCFSSVSLVRKLSPCMSVASPCCINRSIMAVATVLSTSISTSKMHLQSLRGT